LHLASLECDQSSCVFNIFCPEYPFHSLSDNPIFVLSIHSAVCQIILLLSCLFSLCTHARTHIHTFHGPTGFFTKTIGCGTSHKCTNIHNFYSVKYYKHFIKQWYRLSLHKIFIYKVNGVCSLV